MAGLGKLDDPGDVVVLDVADEELDVRADDKHLALAAQHDAADGWIGNRAVERLLQLVQHQGIDVVERLGPVDRDRRHAVNDMRRDHG